MPRCPCRAGAASVCKQTPCGRCAAPDAGHGRQHEQVAVAPDDLPGYADSYDVSDETIESIPMKRRAKTEAVADVVQFLASDQASYAGQNLRVDGGLTRSIP